MTIPILPTPTWLSDVLRQAGLLRQGEVTEIEAQKTAAFNSHLAFLRLHYSADATPGLLSSVVWKRNIPEDWARAAGAEEVKFYQLIATLPDHPPLAPPCYAAAYDEASGDSYLLLQDLSTTHEPPLSPARQASMVDHVPTPENSARVLDALARFHAYWWQHPLLTSGQFTVGYWTRNAERFALYLERRQRSWESLVAAEQDWLPAEIRALYEWVMPRLYHHWEHYLAPRFLNRQHLTVVHGDSYFSNFLCPKPGRSGNTYLLDWQSPGVDHAGHDLVNLIAPFWTRTQRQHAGCELQMLQRYYQNLCSYGVTTYALEDLLTDYRSGLIFWLLMPVQDRFGGAGKEYWWPKMQCLVAAFEDWECERVLGG